MKTKYFISFIILGLLVVGSAVLTGKILAQETTGTANIQYPVKELNNCQNETACKNYCDKSENIKACVAFAEKNNLMSPEEIELAKKFMAAGAKGPGGCSGKDSCEEYCNDISRIDECVAFGEKNNLIPEKELVEAKKVQAAIKRGVKPPLCGNKKQCDVYCNEADHMEECIAFGSEAGFIQGKELEDAQKMLAALKRGVKPPPCRGKEACDEYCSSPDNMEMCMNFALEAGFMGEQEKADSQKMLQAVKKGIKPPACKGKEECDVYCSQDEHFEECLQFAEAAGFMSTEEATMARKTGGKGPGDCKGKEECETFCNNPDNQETCFQFGKENGMIPEADLKMMEEGQQKMKDSFSSIPPEVLDCISSSLGADVVEKMKTGSVIQRKAGDPINQCFQKFGVQERRPNQNQNGQDQQNQNQPGQNQEIQPWADMCKPDGNGNPTALACVDESGKFVTSAKVGSDGKPVCPADSTAKCGNYQQNNQRGRPGQNQQRQNQPGPGAMNPGNQMMPQQAGPGGCKGPEECQAYCESHLDECKNFGSGGGQQLMPGPMPSGQEGQPNGFPPAGQGDCKTPEECQQKMQLQIQNQMQNQMMMPMNQPGGQPPTAPTTPPSGEMSPPSSFLAPQSLLGLILFIFTRAFRP